MSQQYDTSVLVATQQANERFAEKVEGVLNILSANIGVAVSDLPTSAKVGFAVMTLAWTTLHLLVHGVAWRVRLRTN